MNSTEQAIVSVIALWLVILTILVAGLLGIANAPQQAIQPPETHLEATLCGLCHQHMVQIKITNYTYAPPGYSWLEPVANEPYQITSGNYTIAGNTDENGILVAPLCSFIKYKIEILNRTIWMYPAGNDYQVMLK